jgi:glycerol-3-phosphate O-acyltransferase/dihydroxyacetone phosphate acyltransferase
MRVVRAEAGRRVALLMAAKSLQRAVIGTLSKGVGALPVARSQDNLKSGIGTIYLPDPQNQPTLLRGRGTAFDGPGFEVGGTISLPSINGRTNSSRIQEILGPEDIILKTPFEGSDPIFQLTGRHDLNDEGPDPSFSGCKFKVAPHVDQTEVYDAVFKRLNAGGCVGIFPEGGSHDRPNLLPLKG